MNSAQQYWVAATQYYKQYGTVTLTNNGSYPATIGFGVEFDDTNDSSVDGRTADFDFTPKHLDVGGSLSFEVITGNSNKKGDTGHKPAKFKLTNFSITPDSVPVRAVVKLQNDDGTLEDHPEAGTATVSADTIQLGTDAMFTAMANEGYDFVEWRLSNSTTYSTEASCTKTIESFAKDANGSYIGETLTAVFRKAAQNVMVKVTTAPEGNVGTVTASVDGKSLMFSGGSVAVPANKTVVLTAQEADGYIFAGWLKTDGTQYEVSDGVAEDNRRVFKLNVGVADSITLTAQFARKATFTAETTGSGDATVQIKDAEGEPGSSVQAYASQTVVFKATPDTTHVFDGWYDESNQLVSASATYSYTIASETEPDLTLTAKFRRPKLTLLVATGGTSISVNGQTYTSGQELPVDKGSSVTLTATAASGYSFAYWYYNGTQYTDPQWKPTVAGDMTITAFFKDSNGNVPGVARIGSTIYGTLKLALGAAQSGDTVVLIKDYTLTEDVTVNSGVKLLIPLSDDDTGNFGKPTATSTAATSTVFRKLTVASGVTITVNGEICVNSQQFDTNGGNKNGQPVGPCGRIELESGASMEFNSGAKLYAYGYVTGAGKVTLKSGAKCYEFFQIMDWCGGTLASGTFVPKKVFPVMQYTFQNVEAQMEVQNGAGDYAYYAIQVRIAGLFQDPVGVISADGLFRNTSGSVYKEYFPETDRVQITLGDGANQSTADTGSIKIDAKWGVIGVSVDSAEYECPIFGSITVRISKNASFTVNHKFKFLPGAEIIVDEGGTLTIGNNGSVYLYDLYDYNATAENFSWTAYPSPHAYYTGSTAKKIQLSEMGSAKLEVNGTLNANGGLYTSNNGSSYNANLTGGKVITGTGSIAISDVPDTTTISEILNLNSSDDKTAIAFSRVQAYLAGTDLNTVASLDKNTTYYGVKVGDKTAWYTHKATFVDDTQTLYTVYAQNDSTTVGNGTILNGSGKTVNTITDPASKVGYTFSGWSNAGTPAITTANVLSENISGQSYKASWTPKTTKVTLAANGGTDGEIVITAKYNQPFDNVTPPTREGYKFTGYFDQKTGGTQYVGDLGTPTRAWDKEDAEATLYAHWVPVSCTITVKSRPVKGGDTSIADVSLDGLGTYNLTDSVTFNAPKVKNCTFKGWFVENSTYANQKAIYTSHVVTEKVQDMVDKGLFDTSTVLNLVAVYESPGETNLTLTLKGAPAGVTVSVAGVSKDANTDGTWSVPVGTEVTITVNDTNFRYWTNANDKVMSREKTYKFTMVTNTTLTAETSTSSTFVIFQSADGRLLSAQSNLNSLTLPAAPYRVGYEFKGWSIDGAAPVQAADLPSKLKDQSGIVTVTAAYTEAAGTSYNVTAKQAVNGVVGAAISGEKSTYALGEIATFTAPDSANGSSFRFWASNKDGANILSFSQTYSFRVTQKTDIYAIYGSTSDKPNVQPVVRVDNVLKNPDGQTKSLTFMIGASIPENYTLVEMGALYAKTEASGTDAQLRVENVSSTDGVYKAVSRLKPVEGLTDYSYALGFNMTGKTDTIYLRGYVAVKKTGNNADSTIYYYYSGVTSKSYNGVNTQQGG